MIITDKLFRHPAFIVGLILTGILIIYYSVRPLGVRLEINDFTYKVDLAITPQEKSQGLSGRFTLPEGRGMLFVYDHKEQYNFWMKDMKFPLDFVWIADGKVVDLTENVPPSEPEVAPVVVTPKAPVNQILELPAGSIQSNKIKIGDSVKIIF